MQRKTTHRRGAGIQRILLAGVAGGLAEILWVSFYAALTPLHGVDVAREVTATVFGQMFSGGYAAEVGIAIHFLLSLAIAASFAEIVLPIAQRRADASGVVAVAIATLMVIWTVNFFVVLPAVNPVFTTLMPLSVTLASKILFGISMGTVLVAPRVRAHRMTLAHR